jgi:MYXO-CTERM domain-containing protein
VERLIRSLAIALVLAMGTPVLLDAQQSQPIRPGTGATTSPSVRAPEADAADRDNHTDWGWLGLLGLAGLLGLRRRDVGDVRQPRAAERTGSYR